MRWERRFFYGRSWQFGSAPIKFILSPIHIYIYIYVLDEIVLLTSVATVCLFGSVSHILYYYYLKETNLQFTFTTFDFFSLYPIESANAVFFVVFSHLLHLVWSLGGYCFCHLTWQPPSPPSYAAIVVSEQSDADSLRCGWSLWLGQSRIRTSQPASESDNKFKCALSCSTIAREARPPLGIFLHLRSITGALITNWANALLAACDHTHTHTLIMQHRW